MRFLRSLLRRLEIEFFGILRFPIRLDARLDSKVDSLFKLLFALLLTQLVEPILRLQLVFL